MTDIAIRQAREEDRDGVVSLLSHVEEFTPQERECALELFDEALANGNSEKEYACYCAIGDNNRLAGFVCYGETPLARSVYDLYWIAIDPSCRRGGVGAGLIHKMEGKLRGNGARIIIAETSASPAYGKARAFYQRMGFREESRIKDFYAPGDDRVIYCKRYH